MYSKTSMNSLYSFYTAIRGKWNCPIEKFIIPLFVIRRIDCI